MKIICVRSMCSCLVCGGPCDMCPTVWSKLPKDLFIEILGRLSDEALLKFRRISKDTNFMISRFFLPKIAACARVSGFVFQWMKVIYPRKFYRTLPRYRQQKKSPPPKPYYGYVTEIGGSYAYDGGKLVKSYLSLLPFKPNIDDFLGCFNGLFLVRKSSFIPIQYYVCNPATRQCLPIPLNPEHVQKDSFAGLVFDPLDPPPHNYKIVRVNCCTSPSSLDHQPRELSLFSSATGKWVNYSIPLEPEFIDFRWNMRSIYVEGVFYMLSMRKYLLCFNLDITEDSVLKVRAIRLPPRSRDDCVGLFEKSNKCLYYACKVDYDLLVWTFQVGNEASPWTLKYNINSSDLARLPFGRFLSTQTAVFAVDLSAEIIYVGSVYLVYAYDIKKDKIGVFGSIDGGPILHSKSLCFFPYSCCLVRLSGRISLS